MIRGCFRHFRGVGPKTAAALAAAGFTTWDDCLERRDDIPFNGRRRRAFLDEVARSREALERDDLAFFAGTFPPSEQWRILERCCHRATFVDVETTGLSWHYAHATVIAACRGDTVHTFVFGENLDDFLGLVDESTILVSFNGSSFDIPFLERTFSIPSLGIPHLDLRWIAYHMGLRGGLKSMERGMKIRRPPGLEGIDGFEAVDLFHRWQAGDRTARDTLVAYCAADAVSTRLLAERLLAGAGCAIVPSDQERLFSLIP